MGISTETGMSEEESKVMYHLVEAWNTYLTLENREQRKDVLICTAVNTIQAELAILVLKRLYPDYWR